MLKLSKIILSGAAAAVISGFPAISAYAATALDYSSINGYKPGPGDHIDASGNIVSLSGEILVDSKGNVIRSNSVAEGSNDASASGTQTADTQTGNYTVSVSNGTEIYTFEGKGYKAGAYYGVHKLSGYSAEETGNASTASGKTAMAAHTVACASDLPLGTVIILKGTAGPYSSDYNGLYVVEDRGGESGSIETEGWIDIYFDTAAEAAHTTDAGWNYAEAWIAEPIK